MLVAGCHCQDGLLYFVPCSALKICEVQSRWPQEAVAVPVESGGSMALGCVRATTACAGSSIAIEDRILTFPGQRYCRVRAVGLEPTTNGLKGYGSCKDSLGRCHSWQWICAMSGAHH